MRKSTLDEGIAAAASVPQQWRPLPAQPARWARVPTLLRSASIGLFIDLPLIKDYLILKSECLLAVPI